MIGVPQLTVSRILRIGNTIKDQGIIMEFPPNAFPDSILEITISEPSPSLQAMYADTTSAFQAMSLEGITRNAIHFEVEHAPLDTANITYNTTIPIPSDLITYCPNDYGYEIFTVIEQHGSLDTFPVFVLFDSVYDPIAQTLNTQLIPEMFKNRTADLVVSCSPGTNINFAGRRLLQNPNYGTECKASEIRCPIASGFCHSLIGFSANHDAVEYVASSVDIVAVSSGVVERSNTSTTYGNVVIIRHQDGSASVYGSLSTRLVNAGDTVSAGDTIGISGATHVRLEYIPNGKLYATKSRVDPADCMPPNPVTPSPTDPTSVYSLVPTPSPSKSPLVPPNTHAPTPSPLTRSPTESPTIYLPEGSITVRDSGQLADDSFAVYIDSLFVCETEIGQANTCPISRLRPGQHALGIEILEAPDGHGTFNVKLRDGWMFIDNTTERDSTSATCHCLGGPGDYFEWNFTVPINAISKMAP